MLQCLCCELHKSGCQWKGGELHQKLHEQSPQGYWDGRNLENRIYSGESEDIASFWRTPTAQYGSPRRSCRSCTELKWKRIDFLIWYAWFLILLFWFCWIKFIIKWQIKITTIYDWVLNKAECACGSGRISSTKIANHGCQSPSSFLARSPFLSQRTASTTSSIFRMARTHSAACLIAEEVTSKGWTTVSSKRFVTAPWK